MTSVLDHHTTYLLSVKLAHIEGVRAVLQSLIYYNKALAIDPPDKYTLNNKAGAPLGRLA